MNHFEVKLQRQWDILVFECMAKALFFSPHLSLISVITFIFFKFCFPIKLFHINIWPADYLKSLIYIGFHKYLSTLTQIFEYVHKNIENRRHPINVLRLPCPGFTPWRTWVPRLILGFSGWHLAWKRSKKCFFLFKCNNEKGIHVL